MNASCVLILETVVSMGFLVGCTARSRAEEPPAVGNLTITGAAYLQDGTPAAGAIVESIGNNAQPGIQTHADVEGRFKLVGHFGYTAPLHVSSADRAQHATMIVPASAARTQFAEPLDFKLLPGKEQVVTVTSTEGELVADAHVAIESLAYRIHGVTGEDGTVKFSLPATGDIRSVVAWHSQRGVAGKHEQQKGLPNEAFQLVLLPAVQHTIRILAIDGQPVPDLEFGVTVSTPPRNFIVTDDIEAAWLKTDANGEATVSWFPKNLLYVNVRIKDKDWKIDDTEQDKNAEGLTTIRIRKKVSVTGRLKMPAGASAEGIVVSGFGFGPKSTGDVPTARAAADGSFTLSVAPDHGYGLYISDDEWASDGWSGLILADENAKAAEVVLNVYPATPLEVKVTRGEQRVGIANAWVSLRSDQHFTWRNAKGAQRSATGGRQAWIRTDANGIGHFGVSKGAQKLLLSSGDWTEEKTISADSESPLAIEFYRPWLSQRQITGRLLWNSAPHQPSPSAKIEAASIAPSYQRLALSSSIQPDGRWQVEGDASEVSILVLDGEQRLNGFARVGPNDAVVDLPLSTMGIYAGTIVDQEGQPHVGRTLRLTVKDTDHLAAEDQVSDEEGRFRFPFVAAEVPLELRVQQKSLGLPYFQPINKLLFRSGEARENVRVVADLRDAEERRIRSKPASLSEQVAKAARDARLSGMHVFVILQGDSTDPVTRLVETISSYDDQPSILSYLVLFVDEKMIKSNASTLGELEWQLPKAGEVMIVALDGDAKPLGTERLAVGDVDTATKVTTALLKKHLPPVRDAKARLANAQDEAKRSSKKLWIVHGGPRCGPCFRLARWMDDQHALLEKDYVILKVMAGLDEHAQDVISLLNRPMGGIPWYAITDADVTVLTTSTGPLGNIGMPGSVEGIRHLREMLKQTSQRLTDDDLDRLAKSLAEFK